MNIMSCHGMLIYKEPPKRNRGSALIIVRIGPEKETTNRPLQTTNKIIVRIPRHLAPRIEKLNKGDHIEIFGHLGGVLFRSGASGREHLRMEFVASNINPCTRFPVPEEPRHFFNHVEIVGLLRAVQPPNNPNGPHVAWVQIGPNVPNDNARIQHVGLVRCAAYDDTARELAKIDADHPVHLRGHAVGLIRRVPTQGGEEDEEILDSGFRVRQATKTAMIDNRILSEDDFDTATHESDGDEPDKADEKADTETKESAEE